MKFTIYKTINIINNKYYIGMHRTVEPFDNYLGSGVAINRAISKYGKENFKKEVLHIFDNEQDMIDMEIELVNENTVNDINSYNMTCGGEGSWTHIDISGENNPGYGKALWKKDKTNEEIREINKKRALHGEDNPMYGKTHTPEAKQKIINANKMWLQTEEGKLSKLKQAQKLSMLMKGKPKSEEQKRKMSESAKKRWAKKKIKTEQ